MLSAPVNQRMDIPTSRQRCARCGHDLEPGDAHVTCPGCGGLLDVAHAPPPLRGAALAALFASRRGALRGIDASGVWRFRELVAPDLRDAVTIPEGNTPLIQSGTVAAWTGAPSLRLKHEGLNPTGSFKDRGMTVGITRARALAAAAVACASTGNTAASLAAYAAMAGLRALVLVPAGQVAFGKLAQALAYGARTLVVRGDFDDCLRLARTASEELGVYLLNSINPYRIEGQKSILLELLEQYEWEPPHWVALPAGNLGNTAAFGKALREARAAGLIARMPRLLAVQAAGAAPFAQSFREGFARRSRVVADTVATAIRIGDPASFDRAVDAIRDTDGIVTSVTDAEILEAKAVVDASGIGCEPASAASVAGVRQLVRAGAIGPRDEVVAVLTGHLLKDPETLARYHQETEPPPEHANRPREVDANIDAVRRAM